jgi:hypothetical protein
MSGNSLNLLVILLAILTYGSLTTLVMRSALREARVHPGLAGEERRSPATALPDAESLVSVLGAVPVPELCANPTSIAPGGR